MKDIRDAKFYVCEDKAGFDDSLIPLDFDTALRRATDMAGRGSVHVMHTDDASQSQLSRFARAGIQASMIPKA